MSNKKYAKRMKCNQKKSCMKYGNSVENNTCDSNYECINGLIWPSNIALVDNDTNRLKMTMNPSHIKVNLPNDKKEFESGIGEGVWVIIDETTKKDYDSDVTGGIYHGILANDSFVYPLLKCGSYIKFEMRGANRPVALL